MKSYKYKVLAFGMALASVASCSDSFLDKTPDERTEIDTEEKVVQLLVSAYPEGNPAWVGEISSDNLIDNQAPHVPSNPNDRKEGLTVHYNYSAYQKWDDELFRFDPAENATYSAGDSPGYLWMSYYKSIATVNHALAGIDRVCPDGNLSAKLKAAKAEALLLRAYDHFQLVNFFSKAYKDEESSKNDVGVPYVTEIEDVVSKKYDRGNVADVYKKIGEDLEAGLSMMSDINYTTAPKYHFNTNAAHAFAARYYLYAHNYEKVIEHANEVLGTDSASFQRMTMDLSQFSGCSTLSDYANVWHDPAQPGNLMMLDTYSLLLRRMFGCRYSYAGQAASDALMINSKHRSLWSGYICPAISLVSGQLFSSSASDYGFFSSKIGEHFQYTDKVSGIGYSHGVYRAFTSNELLLDRAEAYAMLGKYKEAADDLRWFWNCQLRAMDAEDFKQYVTGGYTNFMTNAEFTDYYADANNINCFADWNFTQKMSPKYVVPAEAVPYMNCINDFRRYETAFNGIRFFDLKRWGIDYNHVVGVSSEIVESTFDSDKRAVEVPWEAISGGMESSREKVTVDKKAAKAVMDRSSFVVKN
ncbi:RagB/SusD family nutrient uptake outer membrane protein [Prevotella sp.]|uniref:RagB/SusD family nutrient uptake outer membrane protein n=1 Tax=Prevotella sp. TaxID=59823 RepID=UPI003AB95E63